MDSVDIGSLDRVVACAGRGQRTGEPLAGSVDRDVGRVTKNQFQRTGFKELFEAGEIK